MNSGSTLLNVLRLLQPTSFLFLYTCLCSGGFSFWEVSKAWIFGKQRTKPDTSEDDIPSGLQAGPIGWSRGRLVFVLLGVSRYCETIIYHSHCACQ